MRKWTSDRGDRGTQGNIKRGEEAEKSEEGVKKSNRDVFVSSFPNWTGASAARTQVETSRGSVSREVCKGEQIRLVSEAIFSQATLIILQGPGASRRGHGS